MTRVRWLLALALGTVATVAAVGSLRTYWAHNLTVGMLAVVVLLAITVGGLASLASARVRIGRELRALTADAPSGELWTQRRDRLTALRAQGVRPDLATLADAVAAREAGRAYLARYLVATTVLVGLVGTFAGLMETLGRVAPLLTAGDGGALGLLAAPLAGLHVTFGASLVAILTTLSLTLAQGDLSLAEAEALALLEERTAHDLLPVLWPAGEDPLVLLRQQTERLREELPAAVARELAAASARAGEHLQARFEDSARALRERHEQMSATLQTSARELAARLETTGTATGEAVGRLAAQAGTALASAATAAADANRSAAARVEEALTRVATEVTSALRASSDGTATALAALGRTHGESLTDAAAALHASVTDAIAGSGRALADERLALASAAEALQASSASLTPAVASLTPVLEGLAAEVAQLAARTEAASADAVVLAELERLGDAVEDLLRLLRPAPPITDTPPGAFTENASPGGTHAENDATRAVSNATDADLRADDGEEISA